MKLGRECMFKDVEVGEVFAIVVGSTVYIEYKLADFESLCLTDTSDVFGYPVGDVAQWMDYNYIYVYKLPKSTQRLYLTEA